MKFHNVLSRIGNTPIIKLNSLKVKSGIEIWAKLESVNPGGSIKDRVALSMIEEAEKSGALTPQKVVVEASSGNTGIGLALVCAIKGYKCLIAMSEAASVERRKIMQAFGADILLTPADKGTDGAIERVYELARVHPEKYFCTDQYNNPANWKAHYKGTAPEILRDTEGRVTHIVCGLGTTGTAMGIARFVKDRGLPVKVIGVEPVVGHHIQGLKNMKESYPPGIYDRTLLDEIYTVDDEEAFYWARWLARKEGLFVGMSSGAALAGAIKLSQAIKEGLIVVIFPDGGERYLSTQLWSFPHLKEEAPLFLFNTLSKRKEPLSCEDEEVRIYTCGPTLNTTPHIGFYRRLLTVDVLKRFLRLFDVKIRHVVNLTDYDDKTIRTALEKGISLKELTERVEKEFYQGLKWLGIEEADLYPRVSEHLEEMVEDALSLKAKGYAYEKFSSLYFDVSRFSGYGRLSGVNLEGLRQHRTTDLEDYGKEEPADFALLKRVHILELKEGYFVEAPFGKVRPTWHIHCATLGIRHLGEEFHLYASGRDLLFPHNENTRAVAMALTGKEPARIWIHTELVYYQGKKLSSSNRILVRDVEERGFTGRELRFYLLRTHYSNPLNFSWKGLKEAKVLLDRFEKYLALLFAAEEGEKENRGIKEALKAFREGWQDALREDLNTPLAISRLITFFKELYLHLSEGISQGLRQEVLSEIERFNLVLGILRFPEPVKDKEVFEKIKERESLRKAKKYDMADAIRDELEKKGYLVLDTPWGTKVFRRGKE
jgi:cysteinyl-tRNA synthetase